MPSFTIALLQLNPCATIQENLIKGLRACEQAKKMGADLALFPEMWQVGYDERFMSMQYAHHQLMHHMQDNMHWVLE